MMSSDDDDLPRFKAEYTDEFWRHAKVNGIEYPVLLGSCLTKGDYQETLEQAYIDSDPRWYDNFKGALTLQKEAILVRDQESEPWPFAGIYRVSKAQLGSFLTCTVHERIAKLNR